MREDLKLKMECMLRRAGLSKVPRPVLACAGIAVAVLLGFALWKFWPVGTQASAGEGFQVVTQAASEQEDMSSSEITVDVEGAVKKPGMYQLAPGSRVGDAIAAAGGLSKKAVKGSVNLAEKVQDSQQINIPKKGAKTSSNAASDAEASGAPVSSSSTSSSSSDSGTSNKININTATAEELQVLSGVGEAISQRIVDYREANGKFATVDDLTKVSGIGDARLAAIRDQICV